MRGQRHFAHHGAVQLAGGRERAEKPRVLLVAGQDLGPAAELEAADRLGDPLARAGGERHVGAIAAQYAGVGVAQLAGELEATFEMSLCAAVAQLAPELGRDGLHGGGRQRTVGTRVQVCESIKDGELGAKSRRLSTNRENTPMSGTDQQAPLWKPSAEQQARTEMSRVHAWAAERRGRPFADYDELWRWSVDELEDFWASIWEFFGVLASRAPTSVCSPPAACPARAGSRAPS